MPHQHACFISYRHDQGLLMSNFVEQIHQALESEVKPLIDLRVYRDQLRLKGGDFYNRALARSLCESVCMIMIFTPTYFSSDHRYCAREFMAMSRIETKRLQAGPEHGLIIPVVVRGFDRLPDEIAKRQVYEFENFTLASKKMIRNTNFIPEIKKMAKYIEHRFREMRETAVDCDDFEMPGDHEVQSLIARLTGRPARFPGREASGA